jgi:septal ring factor EnvC (AmiA/AmiB activator)
VRPGETLWRIARSHSIELEELVRINNISDAKKIDAGQTLIVPTADRRVPETNFTSVSSDDLDFAWPVAGTVVSNFKQKAHGVANKGIDIQTQPGEKVCAARGGRVAFIGKLPGYGTTIVLDHGDGFSTIYCGTQDIAVNVDDAVARGLVLAHAGDQARNELGQVHFEVRRRHKPQNPLFFLN